MVKQIVIAVSIVLMTGCATIHDAIWDHEPEVRYIPVSPEIPSPPDRAFEEIKLPIHDLNANSTPDEVAKAYAKSIVILKAEIERLRNYLEVYRSYKR